VLTRLLNEVELIIVSNNSETSLQCIVDTVLAVKPIIEQVSSLFYAI
jgi:hypothetical protein